mgnify:FL=1
MCPVDPIEFDRAVNNLIVNAYKHNRDAAKVRISVASAKEEIRISVEDDGDPIDSECLEHIFETFVSQSASRSSSEGSGLGLAIAAKIIEKHGGTLNIEQSATGDTKAFIIMLRPEKVMGFLEKAARQHAFNSNVCK